MSVMTDEPQRLPEMLIGSRDWPQPRLVLGITGAPGSGKSTITDHIAAEYRVRRPEVKIGIVAVDPSSPFTGGALLGDRIRMMRHATDPMVFIRSLAARGHLGGLALGAKGVVRVMGLLGCDVVIVETVGVGQSEVEIAQNADLVIVVLAPGQGDSIQMLKAGLMEAGDLFIVNKADRPDAAHLHQQLLAMLERRRLARLDLAHAPGETMVCSGPQLMGSHGPIDLQAAAAQPAVRSKLDADTPTAFLCSATNYQGMDQLVAELESLTEQKSDHWRARRAHQTYDEIRLALLEAVRRRVSAVMGCDGEASQRFDSLLSGETSLEQLVDQLMRQAVEK